MSCRAGARHWLSCLPRHPPPRKPNVLFAYVPEAYAKVRHIRGVHAAIARGYSRSAESFRGPGTCNCLCGSGLSWQYPCRHPVLIVSISRESPTVPTIRPATPADLDSIWSILEPVLRAGETYALPPDWSRDQAIAYWFAEGNEVFVSDDAGDVAGCYYIRANQRGGGAHVANCGYVTSAAFTGRGIATAMCEDSLRRAAELGFRAMQFNFVVSSNERAVKLWQRLGFAIVGTIPKAFQHPRLGFVDAYVMHRML
ncbi:N-acetyltransferase [Mesorhizobium sp. M3A.F.Ca.ET.174.01.1.1]|nr:hypothetical protein CK216_07815 [Mesorhizobium sp. WSM3876]RWB74476.1 MAG: N-acetyltransferase [Mesorhizobium sp.]TGS72325.1 N-acetyltransferase [Mesorhizobium sp. M3A.F.Ca.ET.201.01.1.1]TGS87976.1 N-acetyltransferase [Mesorhizobium sp. M3A.F.Ca.ET.175.01.1.1]TGT28437.1 N-acetyltransferase [Mesorhizobium sp. M3A.F.Ca.ET.174.01.1.1]